MTEVEFLVEVDADGGYLAQATGAPIVTQADNLPMLRDAVRDAVRCHFEDPAPLTIRLRFR